MTFLRGAPSDATPGTSIETKCGLAETEFQGTVELNFKIFPFVFLSKFKVFHFSSIIVWKLGQANPFAKVCLDLRF